MAHSVCQHHQRITWIGRPSIPIYTPFASQRGGVLCYHFVFFSAAAAGVWSMELTCSSKRRTVGGGGFVTIYLYHLLGGADWELPGWRGEIFKGVICLEFGEMATLTATEIGYIQAVLNMEDLSEGNAET